ncbi:unnamed protein product (macronuclear) [Paramecium tetraurelia]|uniref:Uncharacterized protein n=1 Tax=Paramecium tetraurelia TaxID=5888 RepID=A0DWX6_PARTE|nr:uncharacterized protein GSPATT00021186001 [Paramecium tetraurelia]CAK87543.1 unnamed protein product [Paramecium tetraurelia]|eukprot:XP_001454940.1 hypothetical protein (macronuclear) [Paramecium tetraurelia strain d4-2]
MSINQQKFDTNFYAKLNNLEQRFYQEEADKQDLEQLILSIGELVMFYDLKKDPIKQYFLEKMQFILSRPFTLLNLKEQYVQKSNKTPIVHRHQHNFSLPVLKLEKQAQVQSDLNNSFEKIKTMQEDYEMQQRDQAELIQHDIDNQMSALKKKIIVRKQNRNNQNNGNPHSNFMSKSKLSDAKTSDEEQTK